MVASIKEYLGAAKMYNGDIKLIEFNARYGDPECVNVLVIRYMSF